MAIKSATDLNREHDDNYENHDDDYYGHICYSQIQMRLVARPAAIA